MYKARVNFCKTGSDFLEQMLSVFILIPSALPQVCVIYKVSWWTERGTCFWGKAAFTKQAVKHDGAVLLPDEAEAHPSASLSLNYFNLDIVYRLPFEAQPINCM